MSRSRDPVPLGYYAWIVLFALWWLVGYVMGERGG